MNQHSITRRQALQSALVAAGGVALGTAMPLGQAHAGPLGFGFAPYDKCGGGVKTVQLDTTNEDDPYQLSDAELVHAASVLLGAGMSKAAVIGLIVNILNEAGTWGVWCYERCYLDREVDRTEDNDYWRKKVEANNPMGLGLVQWTWYPGRAKDLIDTADEMNQPWQRLSVQVGLIYRELCHSYSSLGGWNPLDPHDHEDDPYGWTWHFLKYYEVPAGDVSENGGKHKQRWNDANERASSVVESASPIPCSTEEEVLAALGGAISGKRGCNGRGSGGGNASIAEAAVSMAYNPNDEGATDNQQVHCITGTYLSTKVYASIHDQVIPGDGYYASCDRGAATAVRWSGADDTMEYGGTTACYAYLNGSEKWDNVGELGQVFDSGSMQPGDVCCTTQNGHIFVYTGHEEVVKKFPDLGADFDCMSASYSQYTPKIRTTSWYAHGDTRTYHVFRNTAPEAESKFSGCTP